MTTQPTHQVSCRAAIAGLGAGSLAFAASRIAASAHDSGDLASHPLTGWWLAMANPPLPEDPQIVAPSYFGADGSVVLFFPVSQKGPQGVQVNSGTTAHGKPTPTDAVTSPPSNASPMPKGRSWAPSPSMASPKSVKTVRRSSTTALW
jgi:hypothetical protein